MNEKIRMTCLRCSNTSLHEVDCNNIGTVICPTCGFNVKQEIDENEDD